MKGGGASSQKKPVKSKAKKQVEVVKNKPKRKGTSAAVKTKNKIERESQAKGKKNKVPTFKTLSLQESGPRTSPSIPMQVSQQQAPVRQRDPAPNVDESSQENALIAGPEKKKKRRGQPRHQKSTVWINGGRFMKSNLEKSLVS